MTQSSTSSGTKRKRNVLTLEKKLEIIEKLKKGATSVALSVQYDVPRTTINDLKKNMEEIEQFASQMERLDVHATKRKTMKSAIIAEKALHFNAQLNSEASFKASGGCRNCISFDF